MFYLFNRRLVLLKPLWLPSTSVHSRPGMEGAPYAAPRLRSGACTEPRPLSRQTCLRPRASFALRTLFCAFTLAPMCASYLF